jgi:cell division protein FtsL
MATESENPSVSVESQTAKAVARSLEKIIIAAFTTRNFVPFGIVAIIVCLIFRLQPDAVERLITKLIDSLWFALLGWFFLIVALAAGIAIYRWRERMHAAELSDVIKVRDRLVEEQLKLKLENPPLELK